jgi:hypothetical protein
LIEPPGDLWQVTTQMEMEGLPMKMPAQTLKIFAPGETQEPPGSANNERGCVNSDMKRVGNKVTWTSSCAGPPAMTGTGEVTYEGTDSYAGFLKYLSEQGNMKINISGRKIGGCDNPT